VAGLQPIQLGEVVEALRDDGVLRAEGLLSDRQASPVEELGLSIAAWMGQVEVVIPVELLLPCPLIASYSSCGIKGFLGSNWTTLEAGASWEVTCTCSGEVQGLAPADLRAGRILRQRSQRSLSGTSGAAEALHPAPYHRHAVLAGYRSFHTRSIGAVICRKEAR
jgi:hypothetical protein